MGNRQGAVENLDMNLFGNIYKGKRILITGHTGFKGSWLSLWLCNLGANVMGISLAPVAQKNHWDLLRLENNVDSVQLDIRNAKKLSKAILEFQPEVVFHLAAQPLVRQSYRDPIETWATNVMGTANVLEACRKTASVQAIVVITTDKCYANQEWPWGYRETDILGGHDPYSASKAGSELVVASFRKAFFHTDGSPLLATARAGNVIGGGDWSEDRLIPDLMRAIDCHQSLEIRSPHATRPWQHVLEALSGYLLIGQRLIEGDKKFEGAWNFGPERSANRTVSEVLNKLNEHYPRIEWHCSKEEQPHEASLLYLDSSKAQSLLGWQCIWGFDATLAKTAYWYSVYSDSKQVISRQQLDEYIGAAEHSQARWISS